MALRFLALSFGILHIVSAMPALTLQDLEVADDTVSVGSYVREVRAAAPYHKSYESDGDGEIGYSRKKSGGGKKGYQHFDTFHKKAGDNYEFEKQDSYGHDDDASGEAHGDEHHTAHSHRHEQKAKPNRRSEDVEEIDEGHKANEDEIEHAELREDAPDGNGGVEAHGHDPKDYVLPEKYSYGTGDEYNF